MTSPGTSGRLIIDGARSTKEQKALACGIRFAGGSNQQTCLLNTIDHYHTTYRSERYELGRIYADYGG